LLELKSWLKTPSTDFRVEPVYMDDSGNYRYAHHFTARLLGYDPARPDETIDYWAEDIFIKINTTQQINKKQQEAAHRAMRQQGVVLKEFREMQAFMGDKSNG